MGDPSHGPRPRRTGCRRALWIPSSRSNRVRRFAPLSRARSRWLASRAGITVVVRVEIVRDKVRRLLGTLDLLRACLPEDAASFTSNRDALDLASFRVYLAMQEAVDLASHVIAD